MALKVPQGASLTFLDALIAALLDGGELHAFQNDYTPIGTTVIGDLTEADFDSYAAITLNNWDAASLNPDDKAFTEEDVRTWTMGGSSTPNTVYGVYVTTAGGALLYAERNPAGGVLINTAGQTYSYLPRFTFVSEF